MLHIDLRELKASAGLLLIKPVMSSDVHELNLRKNKNNPGLFNPSDTVTTRHVILLVAVASLLLIMIGNKCFGCLYINHNIEGLTLPSYSLALMLTGKVYPTI